MRLDIAHEAGVALATTLALLAVLAGGEFAALAWILLCTPWVSAWMRLRKRAAPAASGTLLALASLGLGVATLAQRGVEAAVLAAGYALAGILAARLLTRTEYGHDLQALVVSLLLVMSGSVLNVGVSYGLIFIPYGITMVWALITRQLLGAAEKNAHDPKGARLEVLRARKDVVTPIFFGVTAAVAFAVLIATSVVFVAFPRIGFGNLGFLARKDGRFPSNVSLRGSPRAAAGGDEVLVRLRGISRSAFERGLYLRGAVYDGVDEFGFSQINPPPTIRPSLLRLAEGPESGEYAISMSPVAGRRLFTLGPMWQAYAVGGGRANPSYRLGVGGINARDELEATAAAESNFRYAIRGSISAPGYLPAATRGAKSQAAQVRDEMVPFSRVSSDVGGISVPKGKGEGGPLQNAGEAALLFAVPEGIDPEILRLAGEVTQGATSTVEKVARLREFFLRQFTYTLEQPNAEKEIPMRSFLLDDRRGHCEYFAAAFALMLRAEGIASRVIGGYQGGAWDDDADVVVFQGKNAHAWVEWYLEGVGWIVEDPTPLASAPRLSLTGFVAWTERLRRFWDDRVVDYSLWDQRNAVLSLRDELKGTTSMDAWRERVLPIVLFVCVFVLLAYLFLRRRRERTADMSVHALVPPLRRLLEEEGRRPLEADQTLREGITGYGWPLASPEERALILRALQLYEAERFGGQPVDAVQKEKLVQGLEKLRVVLRARRKEHDGTRAA